MHELNNLDFGSTWEGHGEKSSNKHCVLEFRERKMKEKSCVTGKKVPSVSLLKSPY